MRRYTLILFIFFCTHFAFGQFVNPNQEDNSAGASHTFENPITVPATPERTVQPPSGTPPQTQQATPGQAVTPPPVHTQQLIELRSRLRTRYYQKMKFTFDGKIELLKASDTRPSTGYIAYYDPKGRLSSIQYDGKRPFDIFIKYTEEGKQEDFIWQHIGQNVMKFDYIKNRFFIYMHIFNFIRANDTLEIPELTGTKTKYFAGITKDRFARITPVKEISEQTAMASSEYTIAYYNDAGNWYSLNRYSKTGDTFRLENAYYAVYHPDGKIRNLRVHDVDREQNDMIYLYRSHFYEYNADKKIISWELYLREQNEIWEILYEKWDFGWDNDKRKILARTNIFTDEYLKSVFASIHLLPFINRSDSFSLQSDYLSGLGMDASRPALFGTIVGLFIPIFKNLFLNIEIGWDGMWQKGDTFRYTLNVFTLSVSGFYIIPLYQDTYALGLYVGGGIGVLTADYTQVYNDPLYTLAKERASASGLIGNIRLGFCIVWNSGIFGIGGRYFLGKLNTFKEGKGVLYYSPTGGLRVYDEGTQPAGAEKASLNMFRFSIEIFFGFRL